MERDDMKNLGFGDLQDGTASRAGPDSSNERKV